MRFLSSVFKVQSESLLITLNYSATISLADIYYTYNYELNSFCHRYSYLRNRLWTAGIRWQDRVGAHGDGMCKGLRHMQISQGWYWCTWRWGEDCFGIYMGMGKGLRYMSRVGDGVGAHGWWGVMVLGHMQIGWNTSKRGGWGVWHIGIGWDGVEAKGIWWGQYSAK